MKNIRIKFRSRWPVSNSILLNKSLARILIDRPTLDEHETFYFNVINMHGDLAINVFSCPPDKI